MVHINNELKRDSPFGALYTCKLENVFLFACELVTSRIQIMKMKRYERQE